MLARNAVKADAAAIDTLLDDNRRGDVRLDRDILVVAGRPVVGVLAWRPAAYVHELVANDRVTANVLVNYAIGQSAKLSFPVQDVSFVVDPSNALMLRYARILGATEQPGQIFTLDVG